VLAFGREERCASAPGGVELVKSIITTGLPLASAAGAGKGGASASSLLPPLTSLLSPGPADNLLPPDPTPKSCSPSGSTVPGPPPPPPPPPPLPPPPPVHVGWVNLCVGARTYVQIWVRVNCIRVFTSSG